MNWLVEKLSLSLVSRELRQIKIGSDSSANNNSFCSERATSYQSSNQILEAIASILGLSDDIVDYLAIAIAGGAARRIYH